jgi:hypothetical protein
VKISDGEVDLHESFNPDSLYESKYNFSNSGQLCYR